MNLSYRNFRENRSNNKKWIIQRHGRHCAQYIKQRQSKNKQKTTTKS
jgi:hypothetical protein